MQTEHLIKLNRRYRALVGASVVLALFVAASIAADDTSRTGGALVAGADAPLSAGVGSPDEGGATGAPGSAGSTTVPSGPDTTIAGPGATTPGTAGGGGPTTSLPLRATDRGVSATEIRIASIVVDPAFYTRFGIDDPKVEEASTAFANEINANGGVNGRRIVPRFFTIASPIDETAIAQACRRAFVDEQAFMMVNAAAYPGLATCAANNGRILTDGGFGSVTVATAATLDGAGGRYWIAGMRSDRFARLWVSFIATTYGTDTKMGIVEHQDASLRAVSAEFQQALVAAGFPRPSVFTSQADPSTAALQTGNAIARFRSDGVQLIAPFTNSLAMGLFQAGAATNGYRPSKGYTFSSIAGADSTDNARFYSAQQMNGARGITLVRGVDDPSQARCREIFARRSPGTTFRQSTADICHMVFQNVEVLRRAGAELTAATWAAAYASLGSYQGNGYGAQSFTDAKRDGADQVQVIAYDNGAISRRGDYRSGF